MKALVLSGGSIKGAYQAGAVAAILRAGYRPDIITGISVGALNGGFLVSRAARHHHSEAGLDWPAIAGELADFWLGTITGPDVLLQRRGALDLGWRLLRKNWDGLLKMDRLARLVRETLPAEDFVAPPVRAAFGAVSLRTGRVTYGPADPGTDLLVPDYILASTREPIAMPLHRIGGEPFYDGGLRDIAPLKRAIQLGAREIVCVACQPADVGSLQDGFDQGDVLALVGRVLEIVTNELLNGDLETLLEVNRLIEILGHDTEALKGKRVIPLLVVRPAAKIEVDVGRFSREDIAGMVGLGGETARARLAAALVDRSDPGHPIAAELVQPREGGGLSHAA